MRARTSAAPVHQTWPFEKATPRANAASDRLAVADSLFPLPLSLSLSLSRPFCSDSLRSCRATDRRMVISLIAQTDSENVQTYRVAPSAYKDVPRIVSGVRCDPIHTTGWTWCGAASTTSLPDSKPKAEPLNECSRVTLACSLINEPFVGRLTDGVPEISVARAGYNDRSACMN